MKIGNGPEMRETDLDVLTAERLWNKGARMRRDIREVVLGMLLKLPVKDKLLHSGKVPVNAELRPLRREKRGTEVQQYITLNEAMKM